MPVGLLVQELYVTYLKVISMSTHESSSCYSMITFSFRGGVNPLLKIFEGNPGNVA